MLVLCLSGPGAAIANDPNSDSWNAGQLEMEMTKFRRSLGIGLIMSALLVALVGCQKKEGPAEHAGKQLDKAAENAGKQIEKIGDSIQDAAKGEKK